MRDCASENLEIPRCAIAQWRFVALSFRDGPKDQTRNLEIPGSRWRAPRNDGVVCLYYVCEPLIASPAVRLFSLRNLRACQLKSARRQDRRGFDADECPAFD